MIKQSFESEQAAEPPMPKVLAVSLLLVVSGTCSLLFQTAWFREFRLVFGASTYSSAAVLAIFMGGLGLGNALLGRRADSSPKPLKLYACLEILISLWGMLTPWFVDAVRFLYLIVGGQETLTSYGATAFRLLGTALVIGVPTFLMGGTLPAAVKAISRNEDQGRSSVGILYGVNTLGAVVGCLLGTFYLFEVFGTRWTLWLACATNFLNAVAAWKLGASANAVSDNIHSVNSGTDSVVESSELRSALPSWLLYLSAALVGAVFFLMEMVWYRMLAPILGGSTFTFGLILAIALAGIGLGGALYSRWFGSRRPDLGTFIQTLGWEALAMAFPFWLGDFIAVLAMQLKGFAIYGFWGQAAGWFIVTLLVVFPASVVAGIQFPVLIALIGHGTKDIGRELGNAFAWNTIGSMLGSFAGGFGLLTLLTATGVWKLVVILLLLLAGVLSVYQLVRRQIVSLPLDQTADANRRVQKTKEFDLSPTARAVSWIGSGLIPSVAVAGLAIVCIVAPGPTAVWRHSGIGAGRFQRFGSTQNEFKEWVNNTRRQVLWEQDGRESAVGIVAADSLAFFVNGKSDGNAVTDAGTQIMLGVLGAFQHPNPQRAMVIGLGTGESAGWLASLSDVDKVDVIELEPAVLKMAQLCESLNHQVLKHPKVQVIINDAREQMLTTQSVYDLICSEPSNPYRSGISSLYTQEFYRAAAQRLAPGGIFCQWLQAYEVDTPTVQTVLATLHSVFPYVEVWWTQRGDLVLTCSQEPKQYTMASLTNKLADTTYLQAARTAWQTEQVAGLLAHAVANEKFVDRMSDVGLPINTDHHNRLEFGFARTVGRSSLFNLDDLRQQAESFGERWPLSLGAQIDQTRVAELTVANDVLRGRPLGPQVIPSPRAFVWSLLEQEDYKTASQAWNALTESQRQGLDYSEQVLLGTMLADQKSPQLPELLASLSEQSRGSALAIATIFAVRHAEPAQLAVSWQASLPICKPIPQFPNF